MFSSFLFDGYKYNPAYIDAFSQEALVEDSRVINYSVPDKVVNDQTVTSAKEEHIEIEVYEVVPSEVIDTTIPETTVSDPDESFSEEIIVVNLDSLKKEQASSPSELVPYDGVEVVMKNNVEADKEPDLTDYVALASKAHEDVWNTTVEERVAAVHNGYFKWIVITLAAIVLLFVGKALFLSGRTEKEEKERERYKRKKEFEQYSESQEIVSQPGLEYKEIKASESPTPGSGDGFENSSDLVLAADYPVDEKYQRYTPVAQQISDSYRALNEEQRKELFKVAIQAQLLRV